MNLEMEFLAKLNTLPVFDTHEHLPYPTGQERGFFESLHYAESDLLSAGMPVPFKKAEDKAAVFERYYAKAQNTAYFRAVRRYVRDLYDIDRLEGAALLRLDSMFRKNAAQPESWYTHVLKEKCHIQTALTVHDGSTMRHAILKPILYLDFLLRRSQIRYANEQHGTKLCFEEYLVYVESWLEEWIDFGAVAGKCGTPYWRDMDFYPASEQAAKVEYETENERNPHFEGYLFHRILAMFEKKGIPIQFHTGHIEPQSVNLREHHSEWSDPAPFSRLAAMYPQLKMVLLHTGFPYSDMYFSLVKNVPNLYADFSWIYLISPMLAERNLHLALELIPISKIIGFGGDAENVELVYGHLCAAKEVMAKVFAERVKSGWFSRSEAEIYMAALLYGNAEAVYDRAK